MTVIYDDSFSVFIASDGDGDDVASVDDVTDMLTEEQKKVYTQQRSDLNTAFEDVTGTDLTPAQKIKYKRFNYRSTEQPLLDPTDQLAITSRSLVEYALAH